MAISFKCECDECGISMDDSDVICDSCWNSLCKEVDELRENIVRLNDEIAALKDEIAKLEYALDHESSY